MRSSGNSPTPAASAASMERAASGLPLIVTSPLACGSSPKIACKVSLRPAPTSPASPTISPARTASDMSRNLPGEFSPFTRRRSAPGSNDRWRGVAKRSSRPIICVTTRCGLVSAMRSVATCLPSRNTVMPSHSSKSSDMRCDT